MIKATVRLKCTKANTLVVLYEKHVNLIKKQTNNNYSTCKSVIIWSEKKLSAEIVLF